MAVENFNTYTEVDEDNDITVTEHKCDVSTMRRDANSYVYKDMGAGHFGDFEHLITAHLQTADNSGNVGVWGLSNGQHTLQDKGAAGIGMRVQFFRVLATGVYNIELVDDDSHLSDKFVITPPVTHYLTIGRTGLTVTCKIYSDAARTVLEDTLTLGCPNTTYRYIETIQGRDAAPVSAPAMTCYVENLDLQEAKPRSWGVIF